MHWLALGFLAFISWRGRAGVYARLATEKNPTAKPPSKDTP